MKKNIIISLFLITLSVNGFCQIKNDNLEDKLRENDIERSKKQLKQGEEKNTPENQSSNNNSSYNPLAELAGEIILYISYYSIIGGYKNESHLHNNLTKYPYYDKSAGNYKSIDSTGAFESTKKLRFDIEDKLLLNPLENLHGNHLKIKIRPSKFIYFQTDYYQLGESDKKSKVYSQLSLYKFNLSYDRIRFDKFNLGWTLGANYISNDVKKWGITWGANTEIFLNKPFSINSSMEWGYVNRVPVRKFEIEGKHHIKRFFYSVGYEHLKIGTPSYNFISIGAGAYL